MDKRRKREEVVARFENVLYEIIFFSYLILDLKNNFSFQKQY